MGILLPPVAQVTTSTSTPLTLHHRNRSLDSALQRIPEVDVTPSPECETVVTSILCSSSSTMDSRPTSSTSSSAKRRNDEIASLGSDDSGILCGSDTGSSEDSNAATRESSVEFLSDKQDEEEEEEDGKCQAERTREQQQLESRPPQPPPAKSSGMLRLLESKVFDVSMAMHYLFNSKEPGVLCYIVNKLFSFEDREVDFYLPQLVCMYIQMHDVAEVIHRYLIHR